MTTRQWAGRVLYGATFLIALPAALVVWARATTLAVPLPPVHAPAAGLTIALGGVSLMLAGWHALIVHGRGLPMNAFPPERLVRAGSYRWIRNPIYIGFSLSVAGASIASGSASGLWLVTPTVSLAAAALVFGLERPALVVRFGPAALAPPRLSLPRGGDEPPTLSERAAFVVWILLPWILTWCAAQALGRPPDAFETSLPFERRWPIWEWTQALYVSAYLLVPLTVFTSTSSNTLRRYALSGGVATVIIGLCWFTIPVVAPHRSFVPTTWLGHLLALEQRNSAGVAAFPAFHVLWSMLSAAAWSDDGRRAGTRWRGWIGWTWAWLIAVSCLTTGMHTLTEAGAAIALYPVVRDPARAWRWIRSRTEAHANSWREWRFGPVRIISHGVFVGGAVGVGFALIAMALPPDAFGAVVWITMCALVGAGVWAQLLEGSSVLLRPFGWYGGLLGAVAGAVSVSLAGAPLAPMIAALAIAAPWIQSLGRLRCLVQGCCHGGPAPDWLGIRYRHRRSRVTQIAHLGGVPIHATPLYSIAGNVVIGIILLRMRWLGAADVLVIGVYLILAGIARFAEEGYRAEPQTPIIASLHSYQWLAIGSVLAGMVVSSLPIVTAASGLAPITSRIAVGALLAALVTAAAMGVDFPASNRRFSRLAAGD